MDSKKTRLIDIKPCMRCGRCVQTCPKNLIPALIKRYADRNNLKKLRKLNSSSCIECGKCDNICPAKLPLTEYMRYGKGVAEAAVVNTIPSVQYSPRINDKEAGRRIMLDVIIALVPALIAAVIFFGPQALLLTAVIILASVVSEALFRLLRKRDISSVFDLSAVVTGLIMALGLPSNTPLWIAALSAAFAIVVFKQLFGGLGRNLLNPALVGHFLAGRLTQILGYPFGYPAPMVWLESGYQGIDVMTSATPLGLLADGVTLPGLGELFLGVHAGCMGETSILAFLLGGAYLVWRRVISPTIPLTIIAAALLFVTLGGQNLLIHLLTGSLVFVAIFMATDYVTSPITFKGKIIFGIGCGLLIAFFRLFGSMAEGTGLALVIMNILAPFIEKITLPKAFTQKMIQNLQEE